MTENEAFLQKAIEVSIENIKNGGGPFGAVIVKAGNIISCAGNSVTQSHDPTAHAEVNAIRLACKSLKTHELNDCIIYSSCEPCPMCLSAIYWSGIKTIYFANDRKDAERAGFRDELIYNELSLPHKEKSISIKQIKLSSAQKAFTDWNKLDSKISY